MAKATKNPQIVQITDEEEKKKALANTLSAIEKQYGKGAIMKLGERTAMYTSPTGFSCVPPSGPAMPVTAIPQSLPVVSQIPCTISSAHSALTAPKFCKVSVNTWSRRILAALE